MEAYAVLIHGWEGLTSLKCPYYPMQSVSKYQWHISQNENKSSTNDPK